MRHIFALFIMTGMALAAQPLRVMALHPVLSELAAELGGETVSVRSLVPAGVDPHTFNPAPADVKAMHQAELILASGFDLEPYLDKLVANSNSKAQLFKASAAVRDVVKSACTEHGHDGHDHGEVDPHWWHSIANIGHVAEALSLELKARRPEEASAIELRLGALKGRLSRLSTWAQAEVAKIPVELRHLVTSHDAFGYLARDYGFTVHPLHGISPEAEPDAKSLAALIDLIRRLRIKAVFVDNTENPKLLTAMLKESGAKVGGVLYADGPGPADSPAPNIEGMFRHNLSTIVKALK